MNQLPAICYAKHPVDGHAVMIVRGESGFRDLVPQDPQANLDVDKLNTVAGVDKGQAAAMMAGSMFGWDAPAANPARYDENGKVLASDRSRRPT